jgi:hypothetical protein
METQSKKRHKSKLVFKKKKKKNYIPFEAMITTNHNRHTRGVLPLKAPPWFNNHHHQRVLHLLLIVSTLFFQPLAPSSFTITIFGSFNILAHRDTSPLLLLHPMLFSTNFHSKNHQALIPPPANTIHPITSSHRPSPPLLPTTPLPQSGNHLLVPPTHLSTHTTYQFPRTPEANLLQHPLICWALGFIPLASDPTIIFTIDPIKINITSPL